MSLSSKIFRYFIIFLIVVAVAVGFANYVIVRSSKNYIKENISELHSCKTALLLGTSKKLKNGTRNEFFYNRIDAAVQLVKSGKVKYIIISGDNGSVYYNEPIDMKKELIRRGIADSLIYLDYAGFRTFDSVIRAKEIFGQDSIIVVSQKFHNQRAVYIAQQFGIYAMAYNAKDVNAYKGFKTMLRETFARPKVFIDLMINNKPRFLGEKVRIGQ